MGHSHPRRRPNAAAPFILLATLTLLAGPASAAIYINEILPDPAGTDTYLTELVEIYNSGPNAVDLTGWAIDDAVTIGQTAVRARIPEDFDPSCSTNPIIQPGEFRVVHMLQATGAVLNQGGDDVYLVSNRTLPATVVQLVTYGASIVGQSWGCVPNGTTNFAWRSPTTFCASNGGPTGDVTPPAAVTDLAAAAGTYPGEIRLTWTAPGDDGASGTATSYILKVAHSPITSDALFDAAADLDRWLIEPTPAAGATPETLFVSGFATDSTWYFAIKATDEVPNTSALSNSPGTTPAAGTLLNPVLGYSTYYGNLHSHTSLSDGVQTPPDAYTFARFSAPTPLDFLAVTDHNHSGAGMQLPSYAVGMAAAAAANSDGNFVAIWGQEWGIINTGGHANLFEAPVLFGWEPGNYNVFVAEGDYTGLYTAFRANPPASYPPVVSWCHPSGGDYNGYAVTADGQAVVSLFAMVSGPANSTSVTESDAGSSTGSETLFQDALRRGYRVSPIGDQDNHAATWGASTQSRTAVQASGRTKALILDALSRRRCYATTDHNVKVEFSADGHAMGEAWSSAQGVRIAARVTDPDVGAGVTQIDLLRGVTGTSNAVVVATSMGNSSFAWRERQSFATGTEAHYYLRIRMANNTTVWTGPVYVKYDPAANVAVDGGPRGTSLPLIASPNPAFGRVTASFALPQAVDHAELRVYDAAGRRVNTLVSGPLPAGPQRIDWAGLDEDGRTVPAGLFFLRLEAGAQRATQKVLLVR